MTDQEILEQFETINNRIDQMANRMDSMQELILKSISALNGKIDSVEQSMTEKIDGVEQRMTEKINGVEQNMTEKIDGVEQRMTARQEAFEEHMLEEFHKQNETLDAKFHQIEEELQRSVHETKVYVELAVGKRITALFDGYELEHSHRVGLEQDALRIQRIMEDIQTRLAVLESKGETA